MQKPLVIANWKMNPASLKKARILAGAITRGTGAARGVEIAVAPPFPYLSLFPKGKVKLAAQDVFWEEKGAWTGEVSPAMLHDLGVRFVIIGHSERRKMGEDNAVVNKKIRAAVRHGLCPVLAIGEGVLESQSVVPEVIRQELEQALSGIPRPRLRGMAVAYEPIWAIGTGNADSPENATRRAIYIRKLLVRMLGSRIADTIRILYGGSVTAKNAASYFSSDIRGTEGLLVGGSSLDPREFSAIVRAAAAMARPR